MEEIKAWVIAGASGSKPEVVSLIPVDQTETENLLEEILVSSPDLLGGDIKLVGRQTDTPGGPLDLLGVDGDGRLVVFELKRGTLTREAVAQVVDYTSYLAELEPSHLSLHIAERSGKLGIEKIEDFAAWYHEQYAKSLVGAIHPRMVLVGLGADDRTRRMVAFLADSDIDISLVTFHAFKDNGGVLLTRKVEVEARPQVVSGTGMKRENLAKLKDRVVRLGVADYYFQMAKTFRAELSAYEWPNATGFSYYLTDETETGSQSNRVYASLYLQDGHPGKVQVYIHPRAVASASDAVGQVATAGDLKSKTKKDGSVEFWVNSGHMWTQHEQTFREICQAVHKGWKQNREKRTEEELADREEDAASQQSHRV